MLKARGQREGRVPFSTLSKTPRLQRDVHGKTSAPSASSAFILLSSSGWVPKNGLIPHSRKESQTAEIREDAERLKYSLEIHVLNLLEENPLRSPRTLRLIFFFFISEGPKDFYNFPSNKEAKGWGADERRFSGSIRPKMFLGGYPGEPASPFQESFRPLLLRGFLFYS